MNVKTRLFIGALFLSGASFSLMSMEKKGENKFVELSSLVNNLSSDNQAGLKCTLPSVKTERRGRKRKYSLITPSSSSSSSSSSKTPSSSSSTSFSSASLLKSSFSKPPAKQEVVCVKSVESSVTSAKTPLSTPSVKTPSSVNNPQNKVVFKPVDFNKKVENFSFYPELQAPETEKESKFLLQLYGTYNYGVCWLALCEYSEQNKNIEDMLNFLLVESESVKKSRLAYMVGFDAFPVWSFALRHTIDLLFKYAQGNELEEHCKRLSDAIEKVKPLALKDDWMSELRMNAYLDEIKTRKELGA